MEVIKQSSSRGSGNGRVSVKVTFHRDSSLTSEEQNAIVREVTSHLRKLHFYVDVIPLEMEHDPAHNELMRNMVREGTIINIVSEE